MKVKIICGSNADIQLSKSLSWLLRHGALIEGFVLSPEGYIEVNQILQHKLFRGKYNRSDVERVVANNDKQRFKLRVHPDTNVLEVKANQGHTVHVAEAGLIPILEPIYATVVHGTYLKCWPQIKIEGLSRMKRQHIHLAKGTLEDPTVISGLRRNAQVHVFVDLKKALDDGVKFYESENGVVLTRGDEHGYLDPKYFLRVVKISTAATPMSDGRGPASSSLASPRRAPQSAPSSIASPRGTTHAECVAVLKAAPIAASSFMASLHAAAADSDGSDRASSPRRAFTSASGSIGLPRVVHSIALGSPRAAFASASGSVGSPREVLADASGSVCSPRATLASVSGSVGSPRAAFAGASGSPRAAHAVASGSVVSPRTALISALGSVDSTRKATRRTRRPNAEPTANHNIDNTKILVTGFPPYTQPQDLLRVFTKFGKVKLDKLSAASASLSFESEKHARAALAATRLIVYGEFLTVQIYSKQLEDQKELPDGKLPQPPKRDFTRSKQKGVIVEPDHIDFSGSFHQQLDRVLATVRLTQEEATSISMLYADLEIVLQAQWPGCETWPFGSITTGLGIKSSDADCFVHIPAHFQNPHTNFVNKAKRILQAYPHLFAEILSIPRANTPIVKFFHVPTETNCDLSFKTPLGAQNSKLIAFLFHADPRLLPMAVLMKYWAKVHGLSGTGKLTNYALTMMIIFYLQQPPVSILPSVEWLQRDRTNDIIVDFWNTGFTRQIDLLQRTTNTSSISELLGGFFEYYSLFDFEQMVVCPYLGFPIKKEMFKDLNLLPAEFERYKQNVFNCLVMPIRFTTPMCVQDPFEQSHNVASAITSKLASEIKAFIKFAANAYEKEKLNQCQDFLKTILLDKPKIVRSKNHPEYRMNLFPRMILNINDPDWKSIVREVVFTAFETLLKLKLGKVEEKVNPDSKKEKEKYMTAITKAIWKRKQFSKVYRMMQLEFEQKQARITEEIIRADKQLFNLQFQLTLTFAHNPKSAVVAIKLIDGDAVSFREFGNFFMTNMQSWFANLLKPHAKPVSNEEVAKIAQNFEIIQRDLDTSNDLDSGENVNIQSNGPQSESDKDDAESSSATNINDTSDDCNVDSNKLTT